MRKRKDRAFTLVLLPLKYLSAESGGLECVVKEQQDQLFEFNLTD